MVWLLKILYYNLCVSIMGKVYKIISYIGTLLKLFGDLPFKKEKKKKPCFGNTISTLEIVF